MTRQLHKLSALRVGKEIRKGRHSDGGGLYLDIGEGGRRRWIFRYRDRQTGKLRDMGLGSASTVTLAQARVRAASARSCLGSGLDPIDSAKQSPSAIPTFGEFAVDVISNLEKGWRNPKHRAQWRSTIATYCAPIAGKPVDQIATDHVLQVLQPIWTTKAETAGRLRGRIEKILDAAKAKGHRQGENPARWRGHLDNLLAKRQRLQRGHHAAMPWTDLPNFMARLREREAVAALALEFTILNAARTSETLGAHWKEFDFETRVWTVPPERMKAARVHRIPLTDRACRILETLALGRVSDFAFPGSLPGRPLSTMAMEMLLRRMGAAAFTVHGFRATFKTWATEATEFPSELSEAALAHVTGNAVERAYRRTDSLERRRSLMDAWAAFCDVPSLEPVVPLRSAL